MPRRSTRGRPGTGGQTTNGTPHHGDEPGILSSQQANSQAVRASGPGAAPPPRGYLEDQPENELDDVPEDEAEYAPDIVAEINSESPQEFKYLEVLNDLAISCSIGREPDFLNLAVDLHHVNFRFESALMDGTTQEPGLRDWIAYLLVLTPEVAQLMRRGFFWSRDDTVEEMGSYTEKCRWPEDVSFDDRASHYAPRDRVARQYMLFDRGTPCIWVATLVVFSPNNRLSDLSAFRIPDIQPENIRWCRASVDPATPVYNYNVLEPQSRINAIYDDLPLRGWWPWPKRN